jgi:hypothetical protein
MPLIPKKKISPIDLDYMNKQFIILGWSVLYNKCLYYELSGNKRFDKLRIDDNTYDRIEKEYKELARKLNKKPTACIVGFDRHSPSGSCTLAKVLIDEYDKSRRDKTINANSK